MLDELTPEVIVVAGGAAVLVLGIMAIVWMVSTREEGSPKRPNAQENAPPTATKPSGKKRKPFSPRKKRDAHRDANSTDEEKDDEEDQPARKSILKIPVESQQDDPVVPNNKSGNHHVGFKMDGSPPRDERSSRPNPPTPHPTTSRKPLSFDAEPLKPNPQPVAKQTETTTATKERKSGGAPSQPKSHSAQKQQTATPASSGHKKKTTHLCFGECSNLCTCSLVGAVVVQQYHCVCRSRSSASKLSGLREVVGCGVGGLGREERSSRGGLPSILNPTWWLPDLLLGTTGSSCCDSTGIFKIDLRAG